MTEIRALDVQIGDKIAYTNLLFGISSEKTFIVHHKEVKSGYIDFVTSDYPHLKFCDTCDFSGEWHRHYEGAKPSSNPATHFTLFRWTNSQK